MTNTNKYDHIKVSITPENEQEFDFEIGGSVERGQFARITSKGHELVVDENLAYLKGNMPLDWREPAIAKLLTLLKVRNHPDGP